MHKTFPTSIGARAGLASLIWRSHRLSCDFAFDRDIEEDEEDGGEVLNWTAKLSHTTVRATMSFDFGFSLSRKQMIEMGTFVPDELMSNLLTCRRYTTFIGAVLFADVSGFTPLCERYAQFGSSGAYRLTATLNRFIGAMVDLIHTFGGDLLKFSGDAFLASWHCRINEYMSHKIHDAISCAMHIQYSLGNFVTDVGLQLKVKLAIAAGNFIFCVIGNEGSGATYIIVGLPIYEVKKGESLCKSGDTVVAQSAWSFLFPQNYSFQDLGRGYVKVKQILYDPKSNKRKIFDFDPHFRKYEQNRRNYSLGFENFRSEFFAKSVMKVSPSLRPFITSPVLQQIEASQSLDYLIEMRRVTIMFINLIPNTFSCKAILTLVDETYRSILRSVQNKLGLINKVCLFDKDIMFLVVFGLKGYKDKDEASRALKGAHEILKNVSAFKDVKSISIGITMGTTYCGVVGHPLRKEFTVIGPPVNKAARLMCAFKGIISCDASVAFSSRLPVSYFEKMEPIYLKGIVGPVSDIFKYEEVGFSALTLAPIIRRNNLIKTFEDMLHERSPYKAIVVIGDPRVGKSRALLELADRAGNYGWHPNITPLNKKVVSHFCFLQKVIATILGSSSRSRMDELVRLHKDLSYLYKLNSYFDVKFSTPVGPSVDYDPSPLYMRTLQKMFNKEVILIDDAEGLDNESWKILQDLTTVPGILIVLTLPSALESIDSCISQYLQNPLITVTKLEHLPRKYIAPLVCQMLDVDAAPRKLIRNLYKISRGIPGWVQAFLLSYVESGAINVTIEYPETINRRKSLYIIPNQTLFTKSAITSKAPSVEKTKVCRLVDRDLKKDGIPPTFDDVIMATFDNLTPFKQLMLKCGAILGKEFRRSELEAVMDWPFNLALALGVKNLFEIDILCCATKYDSGDRQKAGTGIDASPIKFIHSLTCHCDSEHQRGRYGRIPKYALCNNMSFRFELLRATIYQVIPVNQRNEFHMRAFNYVRQQITKCKECLSYEIYISLKKMNSRTNAADTILNPYGTLDSSPKQAQSTSSKESNVQKGGVIGPGKGVTFIEKTASPGEKSISQESSHFSTNTERIEDAFGKGTLSTLLISGDSRKAEELQSKVIRDLPLYIPHVVNCTCNQIAVGFYKKLLYHASAADAKVEKLKVLVEFGIHNVKYSNFISAYELLKEALELCEEIIANFSLYENNPWEEKKGTDTKKKKRKLTPRVVLFEKEKAKCYFGISCFFLGYFRLGVAELSSVASAGLMSHILFYPTKSLFKMKALSEKWKEKERIKFGFWSFSYASLAQAYILTHDLAEAEHAASAAVKFAKVSNKLDNLSSAYATCIDVCILMGKYKKCKKAENAALKYCIPAFREKDIWDVLYLGRILTSVFKGRLFRGELYKTIDIAKASLRAAATFRACDVEYFIFPLLMRSLANQKKLREIAAILHQLLSGDREYSLFEATRFERLYYRLNLIILIEIGYSMEPPLKLIKRMESKYSGHDKPSYSSHHKTARRTIIQIWLWHLRRQEFDKAQFWQVQPHDGSDFLLDNIPCAISLLECQLLWFVHLINKHNEICPEMKREIDVRTSYLEEISRKRFIYILPMMLHFKAYKTVLCFDYEGKSKDKNKKIPGLLSLRKALKIAKDHGNIHNTAWIEHSMMEWYVDTLTSNCEPVNMQHSEANIKVVSFLDSTEMYQYQSEDLLYHLPIPTFIRLKLKNFLLNNEEMKMMMGPNGVDIGTLFYGDLK